MNVFTKEIDGETHYLYEVLYKLASTGDLFAWRGYACSRAHALELFGKDRDPQEEHYTGILPTLVPRF